MRNEFVFLLTVPFLFSGCVVNSTLSQEDGRNIKSITINETVEKPPKMTYSPPKKSKPVSGTEIVGGVLGGAVGGAIAAALSTPNSEVVPEEVSAVVLVNENNISIDKIVKEEMASAIIKTGKFPYKANGEKSSSTLRIVISDYGLISTNPFTDDLKPILRLKCTLVDSTGKDIWFMFEQLSKNSEIESISLKDMKKDPTLIEGLWRKASREVLANMVKELTK